MNVRSLLLLCLPLLTLAGCAGHETQLSWGTTAQGASFAQVADLVRRGDVTLQGSSLTLVAGTGVCELRVVTEPGAWLVLWAPAAGQVRDPFYLRAELVDTGSWPGELHLRELVPGTKTADLDAHDGSQDWPWERGGTVVQRPLALQLDADGQAWFDTGELEVAVRRAQVGLDEAR